MEGSPYIQARRGSSSGNNDTSNPDSGAVTPVSHAAFAVRRGAWCMKGKGMPRAELDSPGKSTSWKRRFVWVERDQLKFGADEGIADSAIALHSCRVAEALPTERALKLGCPPEFAEGCLLLRAGDRVVPLAIDDVDELHYWVDGLNDSMPSRRVLAASPTPGSDTAGLAETARPSGGKAAVDVPDITMGSLMRTYSGRPSGAFGRDNGTQSPLNATATPRGSGSGGDPFGPMVNGSFDRNTTLDYGYDSADSDAGGFSVDTALFYRDPETGNMVPTPRGMNVSFSRSDSSAALARRRKVQSVALLSARGARPTAHRGQRAHGPPRTKFGYVGDSPQAQAAADDAVSTCRMGTNILKGRSGHNPNIAMSALTDSFAGMEEESFDKTSSGGGGWARRFLWMDGREVYYGKERGRKETTLFLDQVVDAFRYGVSEMVALKAPDTVHRFGWCIRLRNGRIMNLACENDALVNAWIIAINYLRPETAEEVHAREQFEHERALEMEAQRRAWEERRAKLEAEEATRKRRLEERRMLEAMLQMMEATKRAEEQRRKDEEARAKREEEERAKADAAARAAKAHDQEMARYLSECERPIAADELPPALAQRQTKERSGCCTIS